MNQSSRRRSLLPVWSLAGHLGKWIKASFLIGCRCPEESIDSRLRHACVRSVLALSINLGIPIVWFPLRMWFRLLSECRNHGYLCRAAQSRSCMRNKLRLNPISMLRWCDCVRFSITIANTRDEMGLIEQWEFENGEEWWESGWMWEFRGGELNERLGGGREHHETEMRRNVDLIMFSTWFYKEVKVCRNKWKIPVVHLLDIICVH